MSFDPSLPEDGINVSPTSPLREAALLVGGLVAVVIALVLTVGAAVDFLVPRLPPSLEVRLFSAPWLDHGEGSGDGEARARAAAVQEIVDRLARHWPGNPYELRVAIWAEAQPNALALPGGWMVVTSGLLDRVESENELAFVLGHELGHFRHRDHLRGLGRGVALGLVMAALGASGAGTAAQLAGVAGELAQRGFGRDQERAADRFGLELVAAEYGHVAGAADFFRRLPLPGGPVEERLATYLSTHPLGEERIEALRRTAEQRGWSARGQLRPFRE